MKSWDEVSDGMTLYIRDEIEFEDANGDMKKTKPMQKAKVCYSYEDHERCTVVIVDGGIADGEDFYFYHHESKPEELITTKEYKEATKKQFEIVETGSIRIKICPKCNSKIEEKYKHAFNKEWCPYCGYGLIK